MRVDEDGSDQRTLWCGNLSDQVSDEILYELFLQAGPLESVRRPRDPTGRPKSFAFIVYKHECSVPYALELFRGEKLYNRVLNLSGRTRLHHIPVLDTHLTDFTESSKVKSREKEEDRGHRNDRRRSDREKDDKGPASWAELNALRGSLLVNGHSKYNRDDLLGTPMYSKESKSQSSPACMSDFNTLLQMSQQMMPAMMLPGMQFSGSPLTAGPMSPLLGHNIYPSMQGGMSGGKRYSPEKDRRRSDYYESRGSRRDHPYQDYQQGSHYNDSRRQSDNQRRHDRGYSSSRSSHERERRDRRSR